MSAGRGSSERQMNALVLTTELFAMGPKAKSAGDVVPAHCALVNALLALFPVLLSLGADGEVVKLLCIQGAQRREECVVSPVVGTVENS